MLFNSQVFILLFLPSAAVAYYASRTRAARAIVLLVASTLFYAWWDPRFVPMIAASVLGNWWLAHRFLRVRTSFIVGAGVALNLLLLGIFKYADFAGGTVCALAGCEHRAWDFVLPLGVSFFTFEQISYLVDLRRGRAPPYRLLDYANFVSFFPHLIAGPIVRHHELIPQFDVDPHDARTFERLGRGGVLFVLGLCKKVFLADEYAPEVDRIFGDAAAGTIPGTWDAWHAALAFTLQLYFDFSAYTDMAIGLAVMFAIQLPINFDRPYAALSIREFWRRWHITLSRFLRDYVYIPLGGSRQSFMATALAILVTMLLCGLWHGAGWTFVAWGGLHGAAIVANRGWASTGLCLPPGLAWSLTLVFVIGGWVLFRAPDFATAGRMLAGMAGLHGQWGRVGLGDLGFLAFGFALAVAGPTAVELAGRAEIARRWVAVAAGTVLTIAVLRIGSGRSVEFIYFQF
jgi:D-alanyl-lipoteichoic acid acyltransferase DltB (MBOAT superfamily)